MNKRSFELARPSFFRRMSMALYDATPASHAIQGLVEVDVTLLRKALRERRRNGKAGDFFAAVVLAVARNLVEFPEFNSMRVGFKVARFNGVDVNVPVLSRENGEERLSTLIIRSADSLDVAAISRAIEEFKKKPPDSAPDRKVFIILMKVLLRLPSFLRISVERAFSSSPSRTRWSFGTTIVTAAGQGATAPAWILALPPGNVTTAFALGSVVAKPRVIEGAIVVREILHLTVTLNHDVVDGWPAARFTQRLVKRLESAEDVDGARDQTPPSLAFSKRYASHVTLIHKID